jgi:hypothetical protein
VRRAVTILCALVGALFLLLTEGSASFTNAWKAFRILSVSNVSGTATDGTPQNPPTVKPAQEDGLRFVSSSGNDLNDGLSWGSAKGTLYGALISLPGGSRIPPSAGSGTVYFADGSKANPIATDGVWLMGPGDPNYRNPPPGWLRSNGSAIRVEGIGKGSYGPNGHRVRARLEAGSSQDRRHPGIWLSRIQSPTEFLNVAVFYPGRPIVIGECSNQARNGTCGVSAVTLENISVAPLGVPGLGPGIDITGGSFWIYLRDVSVSGNAFHASSGPMSDEAAAILIDGKSNSGNGLIHMRDMNLAGGGVKFIPGANGGSLYVENLIEEGDSHHDIPPPVWFTEYNGFVDAYLSNIQLADAGPKPGPAVQNDGSAPGPLVAGTIALVKGPAVVVSQYNNSLKNQRNSPLMEDQVGFFNGYAVGESDVARRLGTIAAVRFANRAATDPRTWTTSNYAGKNSISAGQPDPFGGRGAGAVSATSESQESLFLTGPCAAVEFSPHSGDWIVAGAWVRSPLGTGYEGSPTDAISMTYCGYPAPVFSYSTSRGGQIQGDGQWQWQWIASKVKSGEKTRVSLAAHFSHKRPLAAYGPVLYLIPNGTTSDNDVLEFAASSASVDSACPAGTVCNVGGHPLISSAFGTLENCASSSSPAICGSAAAGRFVIPANAMSTTVQTAAVTRESEIILTEDSSLGTKLGTSCSTKSGLTFRVTSRTEGSGFSIVASGISNDKPICLSYHIMN